MLAPLTALAVALLAATTPASAAPRCEPGKGYVAADASVQLGEEFLQKLKGAGINTVIRYYDWVNETLPGKTLSLREVKLVAKLDMSLAVVFQHNNDCLCTFMAKGRGTRDAQRALELARSFSQPSGSAIYFGVDGIDAQYLTLLSRTGLPAGEPQARKLIQAFVRPYFEEIARVLKSSGYRVGVYGSGLVCAHLLDEKLAQLCWLANATSWPGYEAFEPSRRWVLKQHLPTRKSDCFGTEVDLNTGNGSTGDFGQWKPSPS